MKIKIDIDEDMQTVYIQASTKTTGVQYSYMNKQHIVNALKDYLQDFNI